MDENGNDVKAMFLDASSFMRNNKVVFGIVEEILTFNIKKGEFHNSNYKISGTARILIDHLSQIYRFEGNVSKNEITESINIEKKY